MGLRNFGGGQGPCLCPGAPGGWNTLSKERPGDRDRVIEIGLSLSARGSYKVRRPRTVRLRGLRGVADEVDAVFAVAFGGEEGLVGAFQQVFGGGRVPGVGGQSAAEGESALAFGTQ